MMAPTPRFTLGIPKFKSKGGKNAPNTPKNIPQVYKTSGLKLSTKNGKVMIHTKISAPNAIYLLRLVVDSSSPTRLIAQKEQMEEIAAVKTSVNKSQNKA